MDVTFKSLVGSHKLLDAEEGCEDDPFELTNQNSDGGRLATAKNEYGIPIQQARSVAISEENAKKIDGVRSRNHF